MKHFVHICLCSPYTESWGYQENILPKIQEKKGFLVTVIATCTTYSEEHSTEIVQCSPSEKLIENIRIIRVLPKGNRNSLKNKIFPKYDIFDLLNSLQPDAVMIHGLGTYGSNKSIIKFIKYIRQNNRSCFIAGDTHRFLEVAPRAVTLKQKMIQYIREKEIIRLVPYYDAIYAITPACMDYAEKYYDIAPKKIKLLPLGYDPYMIDYCHRKEIRSKVRLKYGINEKSILIVHGGKITKRRKTIELLRAFQKIGNINCKLLIFGEMSKECKKECETLIEENSQQIIYTNALSQKEYLNIFLSADLGVFPGGQSVLWQEAIGCGLPLIVGKADNISYLDRGGNICFVDGNDIDEIGIRIKECLDERKLEQMRIIAETDGRKFFSYDSISQIIEEDMKKYYEE